MNDYKSNDDDTIINFAELVDDLAKLGVRAPDHKECHGKGDGFSFEWAVSDNMTVLLSWMGSDKWEITFDGFGDLPEPSTHVGLESAAAHLRKLGCGVKA